MSKITVGSKVRFSRNNRVSFGVVNAIDGKNAFVREHGKTTVCVELRTLQAVAPAKVSVKNFAPMTGRSARKIKIGDTVAKTMKNGQKKTGTVLERFPTKSATDFDVKFYGESVKRMHYTQLSH